MRKNDLDFELIRQLPLEIDETRMKTMLKGLPVAAGTFGMLGVAKYLNLNSILITIISAATIATVSVLSVEDETTKAVANPTPVELKVKIVPTTALIPHLEPKQKLFLTAFSLLDSVEKMPVKSNPAKVALETPVLLSAMHKQLTSIATVNIDATDLVQTLVEEPEDFPVSRSFEIDPRYSNVIRSPYDYLYRDYSNARNAIRGNRVCDSP